MAADASWADILVMRNPDGSPDTFRQEETVALLTDEQIDAIRPFAEELELPADQLVLREGQTELDFLVSLEAALSFLPPTASARRTSLSFVSQSVLSRAICLFLRILRLSATGGQLERPEFFVSGILTSAACSRRNPTWPP